MSIKQNIVVIMLFLLISFGFFGHKNQTKQTTSRKLLQQIEAIGKATNQLDHENQLIIAYQKNQLRKQSSFVLNEYPNLEVLIDKMIKIKGAKAGFQTHLTAFYKKIIHTENPYFLYDENYYAKTCFMPKEQSILAFDPNLKQLKNTYSKKLAASFLAYQNQLNNTIQDTTDLQFMGNDFFNHIKISLQNQVDSTLILTKDFQDVASLEKQLNNFDMVHLMWFVQGCLQELHLLDAQLLRVYSMYLEQMKITPFTDIKQIIVMLPENEPRVGEVFKSDFLLCSYVYLDSMEMFINGQKILIKNGKGMYNFVPRSKGMKLLRVKIIAKNPYTNKNYSYQKTFKLDVY